MDEWYGDHLRPAAHRIDSEQQHLAYTPLSLMRQLLSRTPSAALHLPHLLQCRTNHLPSTINTVHSRCSTLRHYLSTTMSASSPITQIIRFLSPDSSTIHLGEPIPNSSTEAHLLAGDLYNPSSLTRTDQRVRIAAYLPPVHPSSIQCVGLNYKDHAAETKMDLPKAPVIFFKNPTSAAAHNTAIRIPKCCQGQPETDYEAELVVVIGKEARNVSESEALQYVLGYAPGNDVSAREQQLNKDKSGGQWNRGKGFDTFAPFGPALTLAHAVADPQKLDISLSINGKSLQHSNTKEMIFSVAKIVSFLSEDTTLLPGTVIFTGTPPGVGFMRKPAVWLNEGDVCEVTIEGLGTLSNTVENAK